MTKPIDLTCYVYPGWEPRIRPASSRREWMDNTPESFAYRCLPLAIANSHGWEILSPCGFEACWNGGSDVQDVKIRLDADVKPHQAAVSLFGQGTITFHVEAIFRTSPGWNLWVGGIPNSAKDGIAPLGAVIETDWSPYTFTMNWRFTRPDHWIRFEENEPICCIFPIQRTVIEAVAPVIRSIDDEAGLRSQFEAWSKSRDEFQNNIQKNVPQTPSEKWQKLYYRGVTPDGLTSIDDHQTKLRPSAFSSDVKLSEIGATGCPVSGKSS